MKNLFKKIFIIMTSLTVLTACSHTKKENNESNTNQAVNETKEENAVVTEDKSNKGNKEKKVEFKHDYEKAKALVSDWIVFNLNSFDYKTPDQARGELPPGFLSIPMSEKNVDIIYGANNMKIGYIFPLKEVIEVYNVYNHKTYKEEDVLADIRQLLNKPGKITYKEYEEKSSDYDHTTLMQMINPNSQNIAYFKGDKTFVTTISPALGGANLPVPADQSEWTKNDDTLVIPILNYVNKKVVCYITLKFNDKKYGIDDKEKSLYYYYDVKFIK